MVYLFIGEDSLNKEIQLKRLKQEFLAPALEQFNLDTLYAKDLTLQALQEKLLCLPVKSSTRMVVIKDAFNLKPEVSDFLSSYALKPRKQIILVLDIERMGRRNDFVNKIIKSSKVFRFKEELKPDTFSLCRMIDSGRPDQALRLLNQLLKEGERPERILGGLRFSWEKSGAHPLEARKKLKALVNCDLEIKTGKLKPNFALEKLVVGLCSFGKPAH